MSLKSLSLFVLFVGCVAVGCVALSGCDQPKAAPQKQAGEKASPGKKVVAEMTDEEAKTAAKVTGEKASAESEQSKSGDAIAGGTECMLGSGALKVMAPKDWKSVKPSSSMTSFQFMIPKVDGEAEDVSDGKLTVMTVGGSMEANLNRWYGQFTQPDGSTTEEKTKIEDITVAGCDVKIVSLQGTMTERMGGGPFAGGKMVERENYRKLVAVIQGGELGQHFVTLTGPGKTVQANADKFRQMVNSLSKVK